MEVNRYTSFVGAVGESKYTNSGDRALLWKTAILRIILKATQRVSQRVVVTENISKAVFTPLKIGLMEISCSRFKQYKNPMFKTQINVRGCFAYFWVIFRYIWEEMIFLKREENVEK